MAYLTHTPPAAEVASRLRFAVMRMSRVLRQHAPSDVSQSQLAALTTLVRAGRMPARDLADAERVQPPTMTRTVDALVAHGLAERATDDHDRRVVWISATAEGHA